MARLETERLVLRPFTARDADKLVALDADPEVMRYINGGQPTPPDEIETDILPAFLARQERADGYGYWAAEDKATGRFLGWFHLRPAPDGRPDEPELGYRLKREAWGQGYATEGSRALVDHAFGQLGAARVLAEAMAVNAASRRVMENTGLRFVRLFHADWPIRIPGDEHGDVEYELTRREWLERRPQA
ncbi:MAG TPA: GNAT family N-acetyltransferase [Candidatus Limnocylindrales bacterium]|nr:GNAT family N-acetyltransferase [Candidatus Limnocylindrales bacterium]